MNNVRVSPDESSLALAVATALSDVIGRTVANRGRCSVALSGGSTPRLLYRVLAADFRNAIPWERVDVFWGDERFVPASDPQSNYGMAKVELLDHVPCPAANVHPIPTDALATAEAADAYAATLRAHFGDAIPRFDLMLLGIGEDCHAASLFPHSPALAVSDRSVVAAGPDRVTLTVPVLLAAAAVYVLATGARKAQAVARALSAESDPGGCPAAALRNASGTVIWWLDPAAASGKATKP